MSSRDVRQRDRSRDGRLLGGLRRRRRVLSRGEFGTLEVSTRFVLHRRRCTRGALSAWHIWSDGCVRRRALQRPLSVRVVLSRGLGVTDGLSSGNLWGISTLKRRGLHRAVSRGPLLSCEQYLRHQVQHDNRDARRFRQDTVLPGRRRRAASDKTRLLRRGRRGRRTVARGAVRAGAPVSPRRAARVRTRDTRTLIDH